jgi:hypothetical protein
MQRYSDAALSSAIQNQMDIVLGKAHLPRLAVALIRPRPLQLTSRQSLQAQSQGEIQIDETGEISRMGCSARALNPCPG